MADEYCRNILRISLAQICQNLGWNAAQATPLELLTDVLERYLLEVAKVTHRYSEQFGRTDPNLDDLGLAFGHLGIQLGELEDYVHHVDPLPFAQEVVAFPAPKRNNLQFPRYDSREVLQREEHIPEYLPAMFPEIETPQSPPPHTQPETCLLPLPPTTPLAVSPSDIQVDGTSVSPGLSDKRLLTSPPSGGPPSKRIRLTTLPEEAAHSQYEMKSMAMTVAGEVMPTGGYIGKLPDAKTPPQGFPKRFPKDNTRGSASKSASLLPVARDILSELNSKKDSNEGSQKKDKDKSSSNSSSKKSGVKKKSNTSSEKKDVSKSRSKVKKGLLTPKPRPRPRSRSKSPARAKSPKGGGTKKGQNKVFSDSGAGLFSETIMLERQKGPSSEKGRSSSPSVKNKDESLYSAVTSHKNKDSPRSIPLDLSCKQKVSKPSDLEEKKRRLDAIQSSIDSVLRQSTLNQTEKEPDIPDDSFVPVEKEVEKEDSKPIEKIKDLNLSSSIDDTINAVIGAADRDDTPVGLTPVLVKEEVIEQDVVTPTPALPQSPVLTPVLTPQTSPRKKGRPPKKGKNKGNKKPSTPPVAPSVVEPPPIMEPKSPKDEKFAVFDFPESPPMRSTPKPSFPAPAPAPAPAPPAQAPTAPRSPSPEPVEEVPPVVVEELPPPVMEEPPINIKVDESAPVAPIAEKSHSKDKEKHKSKEHKKEKKEKKKDKEKKKKNKDKDRDKERSKHKDKSSKSPGTFPTGLTKLKIRLGSSPFSSTVTYSSKAKEQSPSGSPAQRPEIPKLVIKPMPPLPSSQERGSDSPKTSSSSAKSSKKESKSKKDVGHIVVKKEIFPEKLPTTPPPVPRTPSPAPTAKTPSPMKKTPSPVPVKHEPSSVPPPKPMTPVPPPKSVTPVPKFTGSESPDQSSHDKPPILKMEMIDEPPVLTPQPSPCHKTPTPPPPRNRTPPRVPIKPAPSPVPSPKHPPSPMPVYSPSPVRVNSPPPSAFTSKSMSSSPVKTPSPSRTRTPSPIPSLPPTPIHHPSPTPSPTPTKPPTPSPTPTPAHSPSPGPLVIKEASDIPPMPPPSISSALQAAATAKTALQRTVTSETIGSFLDTSSGEKIWICPACKRQDDGSPMVGCDICDDWYHWECIGINKEPEEDSWYCNKCLAPARKPSKRGRGGGRGRGRGRGRKKSLKD
ncbi:transcription initiation factor TFIID subunit 3-like isoform X2 [Mizuhopecten yessoensis]|uniref:transcription initiation factor TFIID subunit 3-like isoform X2 n=1 Tax=Mizuhopecten yessoensis TaxID=6573 RepID=UPI000B45AA88|nr:transcription initiation factor TFIID subunit 3-like isoform X2 [Mizuhopecten yessoensis]